MRLSDVNHYHNNIKGVYWNEMKYSNGFVDLFFISKIFFSLFIYFFFSKFCFQNQIPKLKEPIIIQAEKTQKVDFRAPEKSAGMISGTKLKQKKSKEKMVSILLKILSILEK